MKYYVYQLIDPRTNTPFYVGKGCGRRAYDHLKYKSKDDCPWNKRLGSLIGEMSAAGITPLVEIISSGHSEDDALTIEEGYILKYGRKHIDSDGILMNYFGHKGNSTITRPPVSKETRDKISALHKGRKPTTEARKNCSASAKVRMERMKADGSWEIVKTKNSLAHIGKKQSEDTAAKRNTSIKKTKDEKYGGKYTFSEDARKNIGDAQVGNEKHAKTWQVVLTTGETLMIKNIAKWYRETGVIHRKDGVTLKNKTGDIIGRREKIGSSV
jgi:hypothetical protein